MRGTKGKGVILESKPRIEEPHLVGLEEEQRNIETLKLMAHGYQGKTA